MNETIKTIAAVLQVLALIVAGGWAYWKFIHQSYGFNASFCSHLRRT